MPGIAPTLYQAKETFYVTGNGFPFCTVPASPGINFCMPPSSAILQTSTVVSAAAKGQSAIKYINFFLDGKFQTELGNGEVTGFTLPQQGTPYKVKAVATDSSGHHYSATKTLTASYTYTQYSCMGNGCIPGIVVNAPLDEAYVGNRFDLNMQIDGNPNPITAMRAYLDNNLIAESKGATLKQEVTVPQTGTHILTVQGWDNKGIEYRIQENININVNK